MSQYGGGRMGGVALSAGGTVSQLFRNLPRGAIGRLLLTINLSLKSSGSAFTLVNSTGASAASEGTDDVDLLLNALFARLTLYWDKETMAGNLTPSQWRTILGLLNIHDFSGTLSNGVSVPISSGSATAFSVIWTIPVSLDRYFADGNLFANGSKRLSQGMIEYTAGSSLTPSVVLANGTAVVSAVSVAISAETVGGTEADVGNLWRVTRTANLPNIYPVPKTVGPRLMLAEGTAAASNSATDVSVGPFERIAPLNFAAKYTNERIPQGGFDITKRLTPYLYIEKEKRFLDWNALLGNEITVDAATGATSQILYDLVCVPPTPGAIREVANEVGKGGDVSIAYPTPGTVPPGTPIPPELAMFLKHRIMPGRVSDGGTGLIEKRSNPDDAASEVAQRGLVSQRVMQVGKLLKGGDSSQ